MDDQTIQVRFRDEDISRTDTQEILIEAAAGGVTAADLIAMRVRSECESDAGGQVRRLVEPQALIDRVQGTKVYRKAEPEAHIPVALRAFRNNAFILIAGDRQIKELDENIELAPGTEVTFLRLTPTIDA